MGCGLVFSIAATLHNVIDYYTAKTICCSLIDCQGNKTLNEGLPQLSYAESAGSRTLLSIDCRKLANVPACKFGSLSDNLIHELQ